MIALNEGNLFDREPASQDSTLVINYSSAAALAGCSDKEAASPSSVALCSLQRFQSPSIIDLGPDNDALLGSFDQLQNRLVPPTENCK
jgi:hypothetical protein